jgi:hypothetical protein
LKNHVSKRVKGRRGPEPGTLRRYEKADRALFPELKKRMAEGSSCHRAALSLADEGSLVGAGTPASRAKRLAALFQRERAETR